MPRSEMSIPALLILIWTFSVCAFPPLSSGLWLGEAGLQELYHSKLSILSLVGCSQWEAPGRGREGEGSEVGVFSPQEPSWKGHLKLTTIFQQVTGSTQYDPLCVSPWRILSFFSPHIPVDPGVGMAPGLILPWNPALWGLQCPASIYVWLKPPGTIKTVWGSLWLLLGLWLM